MDHEAVWAELLEALRVGDMETAEDRIEGLRSWTARKGALPTFVDNTKATVDEDLFLALLEHIAMAIKVFDLKSKIDKIWGGG